MWCDSCDSTPGPWADRRSEAAPPRARPPRRRTQDTFLTFPKRCAARDSQHFLSILFLFFQAAAAGCGVLGRDGRDGDSEVI